jgi:uncharacterized protein
MKQILCFFYLLPFLVSAQTFTVETVPDPRKINNSHVSDPSSLLKSSTTDSINQILNTFESKTTAQVAVVMLPSIGEADGFNFAQSLFTKWGIGRKKNDNGLLIVFVEDQHYIRFHTGLALQGILTDIRCKQIQQNYMVPYFKEKKYDEGMLRGIYETSQFLLDPEAATEITDIEDDFSARDFFYLFFSIVCGVLIFMAFIFEIVNDKFSSKSNGPRLRMSWMVWVCLYLIAPVSLFLFCFLNDVPILQFLGFAAAFILICVAEKFGRTLHQAATYDASAVYHFLGSEIQFWKVTSFILPFPALIIFLNFRKRKNDIRFGPRECKNCSAMLTRQTEANEDKYMKAGQALEEKLGVTDYDVWHCDKCELSETTSFPNYANPQLYEACPSCQFITYQSTKTRTVKRATYEKEGSGERDYKCLNCKFSKTEKFIIAKLIHESTSGSSSDSFSSSSSSSDSSSGSDWGGGSSDGGGASSTW